STRSAWWSSRPRVTRGTRCCRARRTPDDRGPGRRGGAAGAVRPGEPSAAARGGDARPGAARGRRGRAGAGAGRRGGARVRRGAAGRPGRADGARGGPVRVRAGGGRVSRRAGRRQPGRHRRGVRADRAAAGDGHERAAVRPAGDGSDPHPAGAGDGRLHAPGGAPGGLAGLAPPRTREVPAVTRMRTRLLLVQVLVVVLLAVLAVRLWQVQVVRGPEFVSRAAETRTRTVIVPAVRGQILDSSGRPLVRNKTRLVVTV